MANSTKTQSTKVANNWEDVDFVDTVEKQTSKVKILGRTSQEKKEEPEPDQAFKPVPEGPGVMLVSQEEQHRTQYVPESKVLIMKRPMQDGLGNAANNKPKQPVKTLEQRQAEYKEARLRILGNAEPEEKKGSAGAASNSDDNTSPDAGTPAPQGVGSSSVAQGAQRGLITGPAARIQQQQQQQQQAKKQATQNGRQNNQGKRNFNNQQSSTPNQPPAQFAISQFNPCAPPFQHSSLTNGNANCVHQGVAVSQQQVFSPSQPPPMTAAPPTVMMAQQFSHGPAQQYSPSQQYHQPGMGSPYPHGMPPPPPAQQQFVTQNDMPTAAYLQQQGANVYHQQQQEQQYMSQQQFFQPQLPHYQQMQHSLQYMQIAPPMPQHQSAMPPQQQHMHQVPMQQQQQYPPPMLSHQTFPPPRPQYVQRPLGPRTAFPPPPSREEVGLITNGGPSNGPAAPTPPPQQPPVAAEPTPREKSPTTVTTTTTDSSNATTTTTTNSKGSKKANKKKEAKGKAYSTTRNSYTIKQRPKEDDSVSWRVKPVEVVPEECDSTSQKERRSDSPPENKANGIETSSKKESSSTQDRSESPEGTNSTSPKNEDAGTPKEEEEAGSSSPVMVVKTKKKTKRGKKKNSAATALTVAISTTTVARSNCKFDNERIVRMPYGPDGTKGFKLVR